MPEPYILNFDDCPDDPIEALLWLSGVREQVDKELNARFQQAYFWSRFTGRLVEAEALGLHSHKRVLAFTRAENEARGRMIRWGDRRG